MKTFLLVTFVVLNLSCAKKAGYLEITDLKTSASTSIASNTDGSPTPTPSPEPTPTPAPVPVPAPPVPVPVPPSPPTPEPAFMKSVTTNTKGAVVTMTGPVQGLRYSYDSSNGWIDLMGPFNNSGYTISKIWTAGTTFTCVQAMGTDGQWHGIDTSDPQLCNKVVPQWLDLTGLLSYFRFDGLNYIGNQTYQDNLLSNSGSLVTNDLQNKAITDGTVKAINFDGIDDALTVPYNPKFDVPQISISARLKKTIAKLSVWGSIIGRQFGSAYSNTWGLAYTPYNGAIDQFIYEKGGANGQPGCNLNGPPNNDYFNQWVHVVVTDDAATLRMYINGSLYSSTPCSVPHTFENKPICFGAGGNDATGLCNSEVTGVQMSEVSLWGRVLTATEIANIYSNKSLLLE